MRRALRRLVEEAGGELVDVALVRFGRSLDAVVYFRPRGAVTADEVDALRDRIKSHLEGSIAPIEVLVVVSNRSHAAEPAAVPAST